ncbi:hypothetical protein FSARC_449 [Fusarium sarcochroum]|uniref:BZIP domain-containing protein n=1 Tax=Fusarium sarcochroum TaxID=1208366 RepID=A0A8H4UBU4_9HYPO|nr:hypothetical protein FSARC_449 [Fusarium sarcochroum]
MVTANQDVHAQVRRDRKRAQNRLNQRARRERIKIEEDKTLKPGKRPFRVGRWRIGIDATSNVLKQPHQSHTKSDDEYIHDRHSSVSGSDGTLQSTSSDEGEEVISQHLMMPSAIEYSSTLGLSLSADHALLHLIAFNVCRGFGANKCMLRTFANLIEAFDFPILQPEKKTFCEIVTVRPRDRPALIPHRLQPTHLQMNSPHPHWIDTLPFPDIRDNLIRKQLIFDHVQFLEDIVGDFVYVLPPAVPYETSFRPVEKMRDDYIPNHDPGLILWGEPHLRDSWEVTPKFLAKWAWLIGDCKDLVRVSNKQRLSRGERPMPVCSSLASEHKSQQGSIIELE